MLTDRRDPLIDWLFSLQGPALKWDLETARAFATLLGQPQQGFRSLHIAGTNGKGSVGAMLHGIALASGLSVGLNTSPHLVRVEERIRLQADDVSSLVLRQTLLELKAQAARHGEQLPRHPSFFEMMTLAAFQLFRQSKVDLAIVECGLGGRLDATNLLIPELSVITSIGLDHVVTLGGSLEAIAAEKAGIIKPGIPVLVGWMEPPALAVIEQRARQLGAPLHAAELELSLRLDRDGSFDLTTPRRTYPGLRSPLRGPHQRANAALAIRAAELLRQRGVDIPDAALVPGLALTRWPGRMELITGRPSWLLDGAHNVDGAEALGQALRERYREDPRRRVLLFGLTEGRQPVALYRPLHELVEAVVVVAPSIHKAQTATDVARELTRFAPDRPIEAAENLRDAIERVAQLAGELGEVVVAGSLYLVGDVRGALLGLTAGGHPTREVVPPADQPVRLPDRPRAV